MHEPASRRGGGRGDCRLMEALALTQVNIEGTLVVVAALVLFGGGTMLLLSAVFGVRMGYLVVATGFFAFMIILSALWTFGAPGTPRFLGPKGDLPAWIGVGQGASLSSPTFPVIEECALVDKHMSPHLADQR